MFRPCIDLHEGRVKQIVGGTLGESVSAHEFYFRSFRRLVRRSLSPRRFARGAMSSCSGRATRRRRVRPWAHFPAACMSAAVSTATTPPRVLKAGASHVIVTSWIFHDGRLNEERLAELVAAIGKERLVLDLSCRKRDGKYFVVTDRWQKFTELEISPETLQKLAVSCAEFLVHAVDVEGLCVGVDLELVGKARPVVADSRHLCGRRELPERPGRDRARGRREGRSHHRLRARYLWRHRRALRRRRCLQPAGPGLEFFGQFAKSAVILSGASRRSRRISSWKIIASQEPKPLVHGGHHRRLILIRQPFDFASLAQGDILPAMASPYGKGSG